MVKSNETPLPTIRNKGGYPNKYTPLRLYTVCKLMLEHHTAVNYFLEFAMPLPSCDNINHPMTYTDYIKEGMRQANKNWQLVLIQLALAILSCIMLFIMVGIPVIIAVISMGAFDLDNPEDMLGLMKTAQDPSETISKYIGVVIIAALAFLVYVVLALFLYAFSMAGMAGAIGRSIKDPSHKFSVRVFMSEGYRMMMPVTGYFTILCLATMGALFILALIGGIFAFGGAHLLGAASAAGKFLKVFYIVGMIAAVFVFAIASVGVSAQGMAPIALYGRGPVQAFKESFLFPLKNHRAMNLLLILIGIYLGAQVAFIAVGMVVNLIPVINVVVSLPFQFFTMVANYYFSVVILSSVFTYYYASTAHPADAPAPATIASTSTPPPDTSSKEGPGQEFPLDPSGPMI